MKKLNPHFRYNKRQRNGVFSFLLLILILQGFYYYASNTSKRTIDADIELQQLRSQLDSLKQVKTKAYKRYKFNPNFISDEKGYLLGMSVKEIDRLLAYRSNNKWINSNKDFQEVTEISDSLLHQLSPFFQFPTHTKVKVSKKVSDSKEPVFNVKQDINKATEAQLKKIYGIGDKLSVRIIKYRVRLKGYSYMNQLDEVYGLKGEALIHLKSQFKVAKLPVIEKMNVNTASFKEVLSIIYIDYETTKLIFNYKDSVAKI